MREVDDVHLTGPFVEVRGSGSRTSAQVRFGDSVRDLWIEVDGDPVSPLLDPFVAACLIPAMKIGRPLRLHGPASASFLDTLPTIQRVFELYRIDEYHEGHDRLRPVSVVPDTWDASDAGSGRATFFSGGVDSFYTALTRSADLDTAVFIDDFDTAFDPQGGQAVFENAATAARTLGLAVIHARSNLKEVMMSGLGTGGPGSSWRLVGGSLQQAVARALAPRLSSVLFPSSEAIGFHTRFGDGPGIDPRYSTEGLRVEHDDILVNRFDKTRRIVDEPIVQQHLRVCWRPVLNCGDCPKCIRTMLALEALDRRERFTTFPALTTDDLIDRVVFRGRNDPETTQRYYDEVADHLADRDTRPDLRDAIAASKVVEPTISRQAALLALTPRPVRMALRRVRGYRTHR